MYYACAHQLSIVAACTAHYAKVCLLLKTKGLLCEEAFFGETKSPPLSFVFAYC